MSSLKDEIRKELEARRGESRGRYSLGLRERVVAFAKQRVAEGASLKSIADEIGVSHQSVTRWLDDEEERRGEAGFVPVAIGVPQAKLGPDVVVYGPAGIVIDNLDFETLVELLKRLA